MLHKHFNDCICFHQVDLSVFVNTFQLSELKLLFFSVFLIVANNVVINISSPYDRFPAEKSVCFQALDADCQVAF